MSSTLFRRLGLSAPRHGRQLSRLTFIGRMVNAPEPHATSTGTELVRFTVAVSHGKRENSPTSFWNVSSFETGSRRDFLLNLPKGTVVAVEADAQKASFKDQNGVNHYTVNLTHRNLEVIFRPRPKEPAADETIVEDQATSEAPHEEAPQEGAPAEQ